ncbi:MAG: hypothetical protein COA42_23790 [Alteromonadaceae bacterium]|nr:MAG: hypothetical protein COA42_23790 [Alteromonadaceae bacterium]
MGEHPSKDHNTYLILSFDFSLVDPTADKVENSFNHTAGNVIHRFLEKYSAYFPTETLSEVKTLNTLSDKLDTVLSYARAEKNKIYVLIDEYDNFANTILANAGTHAYQDITHGAGFTVIFLIQ